MGHTSNGLHRISHLPRIVSRTPKWVKWAQETSKSSQISRQVCNPGPAICRFHLFLFHVLPRIYYTIFLHPDVCTRPSWGLTRICFVHTCHCNCRIIFWAPHLWICGTLCWQHDDMDSMCLHLRPLIAVLDPNRNRKVFHRL
jgi:hypothetical protein